jgi:thiol-disulfide isomerase/thioredoxin
MSEQAMGAGQQNPARVGRWGFVFFGALLLAAIAYLGVREARHKTLIPKGTVAPSFKLARYGGGTLGLDELRGKVVMLEFWATWCPPCVAELPALTKLAKEFEPRGLVLVAANRDDAPTAKVDVETFVAQRAPALASNIVFADDATALSYRVESIPTFFFIDREGKIIDSYSGYASESSLRSRIERALEQ